MGLGDVIKQGISKVKTDIAYSRAADEQIRKKAREAGLREREQQEIRYARESERIRTSQRLKELRAPKKASGGFMMGGGSLLGPSPALGSALYGPTPRRSTPKRKAKRRSASADVVVVGNTVYRKASAPKRRRSKRATAPRQPSILWGY